MELGQRIKEARQQLGLSQRQLCGDVITRNMLSLIESGKARPGMDTLAYLSARLGKPMGYFLEEQAVTSPNQDCMAAARAHFAQGEYAQAATALENFRTPDPVFAAEAALLQGLVRLELARKALAEEKKAYVVSLLEQTVASPYWVPALEQVRLTLLAQADTKRAGELAQLVEEPAGVLLLQAEAALQAGDYGRAQRVLDALESRGSRWHLLRGKAALGMQEWSFAAALLQQAETAYPKQVAALLETAYRELGDYKRAYEYACKQR